MLSGQFPENHLPARPMFHAWRTYLLNPHANNANNQVDTDAALKPESFKHFYAMLEAVKEQYEFQGLNSFHPINLRILKSICNRIDDAQSGHYFTTEELTKLSKANEFRKKSHPTLQDLVYLKDCAAIIVKHEKYLGLINEFTRADEKSVFKLIEKKAVLLNITDECHAIHHGWKQRSPFAALSSISLEQVMELVLQLEQYLEILNKDFNLSTMHYVSAAYATYSNGVSATLSNTVMKLLMGVKELINSVRSDLAKAMLERLKLIPPGYLSQPKLLENLVFNDDVVFATLESLVKVGAISKEYMENFQLQAAPHTTLTKKQIFAFNDFIYKFGCVETKKQASSLYRPCHDIGPINLQPLATSVPYENDDWILVPMSIPGHYSLQVTTTNTNEEFIYIEFDKTTALSQTISLTASTLTSTPVQNPKPLDLSLIDMGTNERVVISIIDRFAKVSIHEPSTRQLYNLIFDDSYPTVEAESIKLFYMLSKEQEKILANFATQFADENNADYFIETVKALMGELIDKDMLTVCSKTFCLVTDEIIRYEALAMGDKFEDKRVQEQALNLMQAFLKLYLTNNQQFTFEENVINPAREVIKAVYLRHAQLKQTLANQESNSTFFVDMALTYFKEQNLCDCHLAIAKAELDIFLRQREHDIPRNCLEELTQKIHSIPDWHLQPQIWQAEVVNMKNFMVFMIFKAEVVNYLTRELNKLEEQKPGRWMSKETIQEKVDLLKGAIYAISLTGCKQDTQQILEHVSRHKLFNQTYLVFFKAKEAILHADDIAKFIPNYKNTI